MAQVLGIDRSGSQLLGRSQDRSVIGMHAIALRQPHRSRIVSWTLRACAVGLHGRGSTAHRHKGAATHVTYVTDATHVTLSTTVHAVFPHRFPHRHDVLGRHVGLDVVDGVEDESAAGSQVVNAPLHLVADFLRGAVRQHALRVHAPAVEGQVLAEVSSSAPSCPCPRR